MYKTSVYTLVRGDMQRLTHRKQQFWVKQRWGRKNVCCHQ